MRHLFLIATAVTAFTALPAAAQTTQVIIQANRFSTFRGDAAVSTVDLDAATLRNAAALDLALKRTTQAALFRRSSSLTANPTVQGLSLRAIAPSGAGRALVTLDGIPQNDPFGGWVIWAALPGDALAHAHIVRGAGGGAYGSGALTGVVALDLLPPQATPIYLRAEAGEGGSHRLSVGGAYGDLSLHLNDQTQSGDSPVRAPQGGPADVATSGRDQSWLANYQRDICLSICGHLDLLAGHYDSRRDTGLEGATARATGDTWSLSFTQPATPDHAGLRLQIWHKASDLANRSVSVAPGRTATTLANDQIATPATGDGLTAAVRHQTANLEWELGLDARRSTGRADEYYRYMAGAPTRFRTAGGTTDSAALYAEATRKTGRLTLTGALRAETWRSFDANRTETDLVSHQTVLNLTPNPAKTTTITTRLGADYAVSPAMSYRIAAYTGVRPPSLNELYRPFRVGNDVTEANAALRPETLTGLEFGFRRARLNADIFYNVLHDPVTNVTIGFGPATFPTAGFIPAGGTLRQRQNGPDIKAYGLEFNGDLSLTQHLDLTASGTLTHARTGILRPAQAPAYSLSLGLNADLQPLTLSADLTFDGDSFEDDRNTLKLKAYHRLDLRAAYALTPHITLQTTVANALDAAIPIARSNDGTLSYDNARRLTVGLVYRR